jgi:hypothetical protein
MGRWLCVCGLMLVCMLGTVAQEKQKTAKVQNEPDLSGSWKLDPAKSNARQAGTPDLPLKIRYSDPKLIITHQYDKGGTIVGRDFVYYTDGRGETNPATMLLSTGTNTNSQDLDKQVISSKTRWNGNKLVTRSILRNSVAGHMLEFEVVDEWKLSDDGQTLVETSRTVFRPGMSDSAFIPANIPELKKIYRRVPD